MKSKVNWKKKICSWHIKQDIKQAKSVPDHQTPFNFDLAFKFSLVLMYMYHNTTLSTFYIFSCHIWYATPLHECTER